MVTSVPKDVIKVIVNDYPLVFDVAPVIIEGRTMVPLRTIFEALGAEITWNGDTRTVIVNKGNTEISLKLDSKEAIVNGKKVSLDVPACAISGRTMVPARFVSESLGCDVDWDRNTKTINITSN